MFRRILIFFGYLAVALAVTGFTVALVAYGNDYVYDFSSRSIIQNGHVIINSFPNGLRVTADGKLLKKKTPYQMAYKVGPHTFSLAKDGYWTWQKTLEVVAGQVSLARYVILVPKQPEATFLDIRSQIVAQVVSKDHRHLAYITGGQDAALYSIDLDNNSKPVRLYAPKPAAAEAPAEVLTGVAWSDDASHLLVSATAGTQAVQYLVTSDGSEVINLTSKYGFNFTGAKFAASNWRQLYWLSPDGLRRLDVEAQTVSAVLAAKVSQFWVIPDRVLYVQQTELGRSLWSLDGRGHHQELIQALPESDTYSVAFTNYRGDDHLAVVPDKTQIGTVYTGIFGNTPVAKTVAHGVTAASFSPDGHLLAFSSPGKIAVYDLERSSIDNKLVKYEVAGQPGSLQNLTWFDNYHFLLTRDDVLYWSEFDGANRVELGSVVGGLPGYSTADNKSLVMFKPDGQNVRLTQLQIKR